MHYPSARGVINHPDIRCHSASEFSSLPCPKPECLIVASNRADFRCAHFCEACATRLRHLCFRCSPRLRFEAANCDHRAACHGTIGCGVLKINRTRRRVWNSATIPQLSSREAVRGDRSQLFQPLCEKTQRENTFPGSIGKSNPYSGGFPAGHSRPGSPPL
jgi:hypothetical protein